MTRKQNRLSLLIAAGTLLAGITGCWPEPAEDSVLEGTWKVVPSEGYKPPLTNWTLTFDASGKMTQMTYTFEDNATVTWNNPPAAASVDGDQVYISSTQAGNSLVFEGTLDSATEPTEATGTLSANLVVGGITISVPQGEATLVKQ